MKQIIRQRERMQEEREWRMRLSRATTARKFFSLYAEYLRTRNVISEYRKLLLRWCEVVAESGEAQS